MPVNLTRCICCSGEIVDTVLQHRYCQADYPEIPIGPYCRDCLGKVRICSGCQTPGIIDVDTKYYGKGRYYCGTCAENIEACDQCGKEASIAHIIDGKRWCSICYDKEFKRCDACETHQPKENFIVDRLVRAQYKGYFKKYTNSCSTCFKDKKSRFKKYEIFTCKSCGTFHSNSDMDYCNSCWSIFQTCTCGVKDHTVDSFTVTEGSTKVDKNLCSKCRASYTYCGFCHSLTKKTYTIGKLLNNLKICKVCVDSGIEQCPTCLNGKELMKNGNCSKCTSTYIRNKCDNCGRIKDFDGNCRFCNQIKIYNYSLKPPIFFNYTPKDVKDGETFFFGIENEVHISKTGSSTIDELKKIYGSYGPDFLITKDDSTIPHPGFEIVTQPMTLSYFHKKDILNMFPSNIGESNNTGMHVHVAREAFLSDLHIYKVMDFIHSNSIKVDKVVGRSYNSYNARLDKTASKTVIDAKKGRGGNRSARVNMNNEKTIEFRMFATAYTEYQMRYRIEFLHALIKWSSTASIKSAKSWKSLEKFISSYHKLYPNVGRFLLSIKE